MTLTIVISYSPSSTTSGILPRARHSPHAHFPCAVHALFTAQEHGRLLTISPPCAEILCRFHRQSKRRHSCLTDAKSVASSRPQLITAAASPSLRRRLDLHQCWFRAYASQMRQWEGRGTPVMKWIRIGALVLAVATVSLPASGYAQKFNGKSAYSNLCASCHGTSAKGDGPVAPHLNQKPPDLTTLAAANGGAFPFEHVYAAIDGRLGISVHGTREMPVWGMASRVSPALYRARTWAIVDYLATLQGK